MELENNPLILKYDTSNRYGKLLGMNYKIISRGCVEYKITIGPQHLATPQAAHGGVISSVIDAALGVAALTAVCEENKVVSTVEFKLNYLAPAFLNDTLVATGVVEQKGKRILMVTCDVVCINRDHKMIAKAMGTFNAYDAGKAGY